MTRLDRISFDLNRLFAALPFRAKGPRDADGSPTARNTLVNLCSAAVIATASFLPSATSASSIGYDIINRGVTDGVSNFFVLDTNLVLAAGSIKSWSVFSTAGDLGLAVFRPKGGIDYELVGLDIRTAVAGANTFTGSTLQAQSGDVLGWYIGVGRISYNLDSNSLVRWSYENPTTVNIGDTTDFGSPGAGGGGPLSGQNRTYSVSAAATPLAAPIPLPPAGLALGFAIVGLGLRQKFIKAHHAR
ncbi:MAG: hypothetical protein AAGF71_09815 [Pseudomonadota bacterium]